MRDKNPITLWTPKLRHLSKMDGRAGILTGCPSASPFGYALGPPNPWMITIAKETLGFRRAPLSGALRLLMPTFSLLNAPFRLTARLHCIKDASLPRAHKNLCTQPYLRY